MTAPRNPRPGSAPRHTLPHTAGPAVAAGAGTELAGRFRYRLERLLGGGSFGSVYLARCLSRGRSAPPDQVAVKLFHPPRGQDAVRPLKRELSSLLAIRSDRIPRVWDWSLDEPLAFVAIQYFPSRSLHETLADEPLDEAQTRRLLADLLTALHAAHQASLLHLDIKPANVLHDGEGGYVLTDFGISQSCRVDSPELVGGFGTPHYRAPEQRIAAAELLDTRTDLWGVGATVWAAHTGLDLARRPDLLHSPEASLAHGLPSLCRYRPETSPELEALVLELLALDPGERPGSAAEVLQRLRGFEPTGTHRPDTPPRRTSLAPAAARELTASLMDPLLLAVLHPGDGRPWRIVHFADGELLGREGDTAHTTYLLLRGRVRIELGERRLHCEEREGTFLGEVATWTGQPRTATMVAEGPVWACELNAAELEELVIRHPAVGLRLIRSMAERLARTP